MISFDPEKGRNKKSKSQPQAGIARVTVARRESSGLNSFEAWSIFLNGENIGRIGDRESITARTGKRKNVLEARSADGAVSGPLRFNMKSGTHSQVVFNGGRFTETQGIDIIMPAGVPKVFERMRGSFDKIKGDPMSKRRIWFYWAVLTGYFMADFFLARGHIFLAFVLPLLPVIVIGSIAGSIYNEMIVYLSERHPEAWNRIALEKVNSFRGGSSLLFLDRGIGDPVYKKLRNQYKRIRFIQIFFGFIGFILFIYSIDTVVRR